MAEDNIPFSPLDPLGPEYGRVDLPTIDTKGISPFEGDKIEQPKINFPKPEVPVYRPILPGVSGTVIPKQNIQKVIGKPPGPAAPPRRSPRRNGARRHQR